MHAFLGTLAVRTSASLKFVQLTKLLKFQLTSPSLDFTQFARVYKHIVRYMQIENPLVSKLTASLPSKKATSEQNVEQDKVLH
jgi:hypothetical protein